MKILISIFFITGFIFLISFLTGWLFLFSKNASLRLKSAYSIYLAICTFFYITSCILVFAGGLVFKQNMYLFYIIFAFAPFIIGNLSSYKKIKFYTLMQVLTLLSGCISAFFILISGLA